MDYRVLLVGAFASLLVGFSKTGMPGLGILFVPLIAFVFPSGKLSVGAVLPMLIVGDIFAIIYYHRHAQWGQLRGLFLWVFIGLMGGVGFLLCIKDQQLKPILGALVLGMLALELLRRRFGFERVPHTRWFAGLTGFLCGFTTMVGNVAGPIMNIFLISKDLKKNEFMGTGAWYFFIINCSKVPLMFLVGWLGKEPMIDRSSLWFNLQMTPIIIVGALLGVRVLPLIPQEAFNKATMFLAAIAALKLLFS